VKNHSFSSEPSAACLSRGNWGCNAS